MGNICCLQEISQKKKSSIVPNHTINYNHTSQSNFQSRDPNQLKNPKYLIACSGKSNQKVPIDQQKIAMFQEYSFTIQKLGNETKICDVMYKGMKLGRKIKEEGIAEYYQARLYTDKQSEYKNCQAKRIYKSKKIDENQKKLLSIQYIVCSLASHPFLDHLLHYYENESEIYLFYNNNFRYLHQYTSVYSKQDLNVQFCKDLEDKIKFIIAGIILGLEKLHELGVAYCSFSLENIVILPNGYPLLTNLDQLSPFDRPPPLSTYNNFSAPEWITNWTLVPSSDLWSVGILIYYLINLTFPAPNLEINRNQIFSLQQKQLKYQVSDKYPISQSLVYLINQLLITDINRRPLKTVSDIKNHIWFKEFDWVGYAQQQMVSPLQHFHVQDQQNLDLYYSNYTSMGFMESSFLLGLPLMFLLSDIYADNYQIKVFEEVRNEGQEKIESNEHQMASAIDIGNQDDGYYAFDGGDYD